MKIHDVSLTLSESMHVYPGDPKPHFEKKLQLEEGDIASVTFLKMGAHTGTHVDAPCHFIKGGESIENLPLKLLFGRALLLEVLKEELITEQVLEEANIPKGTERLLLKTDNSSRWASQKEFDSNYVAISEGGAEYLVKKGIRLIGVDTLSVAPFDAAAPTHHILLKKNILIVEGLDFSKVRGGSYTFCCLPLKIAGSDGAPARAILIEDGIT